MQKTIKSIQEQTFKNFEVWIIDGGSSKTTQDFLRELEQPFFYISEKDKGIYDAMNKGITLSKGNWLYFLGAGDVLKEEETIMYISNSFNKKIELLLGNIQYKTCKDDSVFLKQNNGVFTSTLSFLLWLKNTAHHQSMIYNRSVFKNKVFDDSYKILSDYNFNLFLFKNNVAFFKLNKIIAICDSKGVSKKYTWSLYKEEIIIKTKNSSILLKPFFIIISFFKFLIKICI